MQYLWFTCVPAIRRLYICTSRPLIPRASRRALRRCPGGPGGFLDESARPRAIKVRYSTHGSVAIVPNVSNKRKNSIASYPVLTRTLAPPCSIVPSVVCRTAQHFLNGEHARAFEAVGNRACATVQYQRTPRRRNIRSDSRPQFSLWTEIAVGTTTDTRRLSHAQPRAIVARKSLKSTGKHARRPTSFTDF